MEKKCYDCEYRGTVPGDAHSCCKHPSIDENPLAELMGILGMSVGGCSARDELNIRANEHGVRMGWFIWPVNFDPVWLENCDGFKERGNDE
jgi:hypothetical protein